MLKKPSKFIGKNVLRFEDDRLLSGNAEYTSDLKFDNLLHLTFLRSNISHGKIISINTKNAKKLKGVHGVFTYKDFENIPPIKSNSRMKGYHATSQYILCNDKVRYVGEPIAVILAENRYIGEDAVEQMYRRFYFRRRTIIPIVQEMLGNPQMLVRRLREGREFMSYLKERRARSLITR